jgi:hypothetical protein
LVAQDAPVAAAHLAGWNVPLVHRVDSRADVFVEFVVGHAIQALASVVFDELGHGRALGNERIRDTPQIAKRPVDDAGAQVGSHEEDAVVDGVEDGIELGQ